MMAAPPAHPALSSSGGEGSQTPSPLWGEGRGEGPVLSLAGIRVAHAGRAVLDVPALAVAQGEVLAVIGPNGAGKSTLLRMHGTARGAGGG